MGATGPSPNTQGPAGPRVALLLPLSGPNAGLGQAMLQAAQVAVGVSGAPNMVLDPHDTTGTPQGAAMAAQAALAAGDSLILGPATAPETEAVAPIAVAAHVPVLAFTSDPSQARPGVWTLGITPVQQVRRLVEAAQAEGRSHFAGLISTSPLGSAMGEALTEVTSDDGLSPPTLQTYDGGTSAMQTALASLTGYTPPAPPAPPGSPPGSPPPRSVPPAASPSRPARVAGAQGSRTMNPIRSLSPSGDVNSSASPSSESSGSFSLVAPPAPPPEAVSPGMATAATPAAPPPPAPPFDVLMLSDYGSRLTALAALLPHYGITAANLQVFGPGLWANSADQMGSLAGAWYADPDPSARADFVRRYSARFGAPPPRLADLAYDAASLARVLAQGPGFTIGALTRPDGFAGCDGVLGLLPDGHVRRGLAVFQIDQGGGSHVVSPAPQTLAGTGV
jgi:ABC-type branched-subunit amino acid transport system substrate-binding protein